MRNRIEIQTSRVTGSHLRTRVRKLPFKHRKPEKYSIIVRWLASRQRTRCSSADIREAFPVRHRRASARARQWSGETKGKNEKQRPTASKKSKKKQKREREERNNAMLHRRRRRRRAIGCKSNKNAPTSEEEGRERKRYVVSK